jgi:hypothetical protein
MREGFMLDYTKYLRRRSTPPSDLTEIVSEIRSRWRFKLALRGAAYTVAVAAVLLLVAAYGMEWARFSASSIITARILLAATVVASAFYFLVRPLRRRVTDEQVALYLEEHEPSLQATLVSAVEASRLGSRSASAVLVRRLVEQALEACAATGAARRVEDAPLRRWGGLLVGVSAAIVLTALLGPAVIRNALSAILLIQRSVEAAAPYRIEVTPGNATVPKGADQTVTATLAGFAAEDASLMLRRVSTSTFEALPLVRGEDGRYEGMVFDVAASLEYFVEAEGVRSAVFTLNVVDVPYVQRLELEYRFPAYTGLEPQKIEDGGDIAVLRGTDVHLRVFPTMKTSGGRIALNEKESAALALQADGTLTGVFKADRDGFYRIELETPTGQRTAASPQYTIDVLTDQAPTVSFQKPGRDTSASSIEEVYVEARAEDDFGVRDLELVYSVNGAAEKSIKLFGGRARLPEVSAGHTFYLEELGVEAGDSVSYYARAVDNAAQGQRATSDLYFLRIRPFKKDFRQAQSQDGGGGGGGGAGGGQVEALSEQQRQIISATFNVQRDRRTYSPAKLRESATVVGLSQSRLREQVEGLLKRLNSQLVQRDPAFEKIAELLPQAVDAMKEAETKLAAASPDGALPAEHRALRILQKAEEEYEQQVSVQRNAGGGGGGAASAQQQELAEIFEQELEKMASRYETATEAQEQSGDRQVDELLEKLKELARRQEQEAARQRLRALEQGGGSSSGGAAQQRALAEQAEEAARRLERLAREESRPDLQDAAREMQRAADAMRRAAAGGDANAAADAAAALDRLRETERRLQQNQAGRAERDIDDAIQQADDIARRQREISEDARRVANEPASAGRRDEARRINEQKSDLETRLNGLEQQLDRSARDAAGTERAASRKMAEAAGAIRDNRLADKVRYSQNLINRTASSDAVDAAEKDIAGGIEQVRKRLGEAATALGQSENANRMENALERARRLARAAESLQERTRERAEQQGQRRRDQSEDQQAREGQGQQRDGQQEGQQGEGGQQGSEGAQSSQGSQGASGGDGADSGGRADGAQAGGFAGGPNGVWGGEWGGGYRRGWEWGDNWRLSPEDIRQFRGEMRQWLNEAQALRRDLAAERIDPRELDEILRALRQLDDPRVYQDVSELQRLQSTIAEGLKRFEFGLRRQVDATQNNIVLSGSDEVPEEFRKLVQEYYRSLARTAR